MLGGGILGNGNGRFADKVLKVPAKKTPAVLRWILNDFEKNKTQEQNFFDYYDRQTKDYFYQNLKHFSDTDQLKSEDFIEWGNETKYEKAIGIGECAGVTIDLIQTLIFEAEEAYAWALSSLKENKLSDGVYHAFNARVRAAKALLTAEGAKTNSHHSIIEGFDLQFPNYHKENGKTFKAEIAAFKSEKPEITFATAFVKETQSFIAWIKKERDAKQ